MEHFYVKFGDPSCSGFEIWCGKTARQREFKTLMLSAWVQINIKGLVCKKT